MTRSQFFKHFDLLADQPDAVAKMRELVWQLAVQGKLLSQNPQDERATRLVEQIREQKSRLTKAGKIRKTPLLPPIEESDHHFKIPPSWAWIHLNDIGEWGSGSTPERGRSEFYGGDIPWLKSGELNDGYVTKSEEHLTKLALEKCSLRLNQPGDVLIAMYGATVGKVAILEIEATTNQAVCACTCFDGVFNRYLFLLLKAYKQRFIAESAGAAQPNFSKDKIIRTIAPLPPLAEQRRIVAKVDELMALCDELEQRQQARQHASGLLQQSALHHLLAAREPATFAAAWQRVRDHFHLLHDTPDALPQLRQAILQLAVQGRLNANAKLWPAEPKPLGQFAPMQNGYAFKSEWFVPKGVRLLRNANVSHDELRWDDMECIASNRVKEFERFELAEGDVVLSLDRPFISTGIKVARVRKEDLPCLLLQRVGRFQPDTKQIHPDYLFLWLNSPHFTSQIDPGRSNGVPHISSKQVEASEIFVPPLAEQKRIVARVEELLRWCDTLEAQLHQTRTLGAHLLASTLHHLLAA